MCPFSSELPAQLAAQHHWRAVHHRIILVFRTELSKERGSPSLQLAVKQAVELVMQRAKPGETSCEGRPSSLLAALKIRPPALRVPQTENEVQNFTR